MNNFDEYTMLDARDLGGDIGFVEEEVQELCERYGASVDEMKSSDPSPKGSCNPEA